ncbi:MAG: glycoside hydrolase family 2 TIM barrel-domain containing protein [Algibacter sp.]|uniref:glycoside hydrolase family 2 protein n=1 Tax=Algibacter sp. TaxID=1872428 RepID=UPI00261B396E|nr:glycoside hydrolase family 2 TIM barrel-domain containing protein [Algibacter sp.]MDG1730757.1 glycoside hydrolase family 2 TIM barrel-domain containing protein [Algibacter sp.]MDG2179859.1 glycoside hydrolase family 2 TIM barrel-domain containing protein [Algibacter sp.]
MIKYLIIFIAICMTTHAQETQIQYLSGTGAEDTVPWEFYCSDGMNSKNWTTIEVPSCWEQQGFGAYNYGLVPFENRLKETGTYKHQFQVPKAWKSKQVNIVFEGVMTDAEVSINGKTVGPIHQGAFYEFKYDITKFLNFGEENLIRVVVKKFSGNESVNYAERKADYWVFGGIFRPVYLEAKSKENIQKVAINAKADGSFEALVHTSDLKKVDQIEVDIQTLDGTSKYSFTTNSEKNKTYISGICNSPKLWNPESPFLYQAVFKLKSGSKVTHQHTETFGFRTVEIRASDGVYINDVKVKLKGVNKHTFHPDFGRTSSKQLSIKAVELIKEMNMNAVRMSHYPPDKHFLSACDSIGLFVLDELAGWQKPAYDDVVGLKLLNEMISRDVNHPSIILWDNGNEGGWNNTLNDDFTKLDIQKREVLHPWQNYGKFNTRHYFDYDYLALDNYGKRKIFLPTEFLHGLYDGGHAAGLEDYWLRIWNHPLAAGGFLWVFADEGIARSDRNGDIDVDGNHAPDGIVDPYYEKEASFYKIKEVWSPVFIEKRYITPNFNGVFNIENRYHFTNLEECRFTADWMSYESGVLNIASSEAIKVKLNPNQKGKLNVKLPVDWRKHHILKLTATDKFGKSINTWSYPLQTANEVSSTIKVARSTSKVILTEDSNQYTVQVGDIAGKFNKNSGLLSSLAVKNKRVPLNNGPILVGSKKQVKDVKALKHKDGSVSIVTIYTKTSDSIVWNIKGNGLFDLKVSYQPSNSGEYEGITFSYPEDKVSHIKWMGQGPYRVWKNRKQESSFGVWNKIYNQSVTGYSEYNYPEFKGYYADMYWAEIQGIEKQGFKVYSKSNDIFIRLLTPEQPSDGKHTIVKFPSGNISFLHGINAIGTKFKTTSKLGPQSTLNSFSKKHFYGEKLKMNLVFDFGSYTH